MRLTHTLDSQKVHEFALRHEGKWHGYAKDARTRKAVDRAEILGAIEVSRETEQFRLKPYNPLNLV